MAADAALCADESRLRFFLTLACLVETYATEGCSLPAVGPTQLMSHDCIRPSAELTQALSGGAWEARRLLHHRLPCACFGAAYAATCALPGCGARHEPYAERKLQRCSQCKLTFYCGAAHSKEHWREHRKTCRKPEDAA